MENDLAELSLAQIIDMFGMERHPAAGWFNLHYSDSEAFGRPKISSIYVLLADDDPLPMHKLDNVEVWHHYRGAPAEVTVSNGIGAPQVSIIGSDIVAGQRPQLAIPAFFWQSIRPLGRWSLLGCTMSPGFSSSASFLLSAAD